MKAKQNAIKFILLGMLILGIIPRKLYAQSSKKDSLSSLAIIRDSILKDSLEGVARNLRTAELDGGRLRLNALQRQKFNADKKNPNSDLFKPTKKLVSDTTLLYDSVYIAKFRSTAYNKALKYKKRTVGHYFLVGGIYLVTTYALFLTTLGILFFSGALTFGKD